MIRFQYLRRDGKTLMCPREVLTVVNNTWLHAHEIEKARKVAVSGTDEECAKLLAWMEEEADFRQGQWRNTL
jgi:hypothetical protein